MGPKRGLQLSPAPSSLTGTNPKSAVPTPAGRGEVFRPEQNKRRATPKMGRRGARDFAAYLTRKFLGAQR